jgi:hypothetical protein
MALPTAVVDPGLQVTVWAVAGFVYVVLSDGDRLRWWER